MAMWKFSNNKTRKPEVWDEPIEDAIGDIEAAHKIREICRSAAGSADSIGAAADRTHAKIKPEVERYERAVKVAMAIAMKISDGLLRDAAVRQIIDLCLRAGHTKTAQTLFRAIQSESISQEVLKEHPSLGGA